MKNIAVIGLGHPHIFAMIEDALAEKDSLAVTAICDPNTPEAVEKAAQMVPGAKIYDDMDELLAKEDIDIVFSSSIFGHKSNIALKSLKAGKHVFIDKPLATTMEGLEAIEAELKKNPSLKLTVFLSMRYASTNRAAKQIIDSGEIGDVVNMHFMGPHRLAPAGRPAWFFDEALYGGILNDIGVHNMDLARWFTNSECKEILASHAGNKRFKDWNIEDEGVVMFMMESGAVGIDFESWLTPEKCPVHGDVRAVIYGTKGQIDIRYWPETEVSVCSDDRVPQIVPLEEAPVNAIQDFIRAIDDPNHKPLITNEDSIKATRFALEAQRKANAAK